MTKIWPQFLPKSASGRRKFALFLLPLLLSCQSVENTRKVAVQMSQTAQELRDFYMALTVTVAQQAELERLQSAFFAVPLSQQDLTQLESTQEELKKRSEMAESLSEFSQTLAEFAGPKTKETVAQSATNLGIALAGIQQLPGAGFIPEALQHSGNLLVQWIQQRNTRKMAQAMDSTLAALAEMFSREKPAYDSINRTYMELAQSLALELLRRKQIRFDSLALPALKPFGLVPAVPAEASSSSLQEYARKQITEKTDEEMAAYVKASEDLQEMLDFMAQRTHALASGGPLPVTEPQPKSTEIERWVHLVAGESKTCENSP